MIVELLVRVDGVGDLVLEQKQVAALLHQVGAALDLDVVETRDLRDKD